MQAERTSLATFLVPLPGLNSTLLSLTRTHSIDWCAASALLSVEPVPDKPFTKASVHIGGCMFSIWTMPPFFLRARSSGRVALERNTAGARGSSQAVNRFLAIVGASGSGKSSVARAGLVAALYLSTTRFRAVPGHESPRMTKLCDRTKDEITLSEGERIRL